MIGLIGSIKPWLALGVVASTAATDAVYVMFTAAVGARRQGAGGDVEQRMVFAFGVCGDQLHAELGVCLLRCDWVVAGRVCIGDVIATITWKRRRTARADGGKTEHLNSL